MEYRILGRTGLKVSEIGLGGEWFNGLTAGETAAILDAAQENGVKVVIVGCHTVQEVLDAVKYYDTPASERSYSHIFSAGNAIHMTGRCMYCNHCQPCPSHIDIAAVTKFLDLAVQQDTVPETVAQHYWALSATADDCLMCGRCEPNCPFGVQIRENMKRARAVFAPSRPV